MMTAGRITERQVERQRSKAEWEAKKRKKASSRKTSASEAKQPDDRLRAPELIRALERMYAATGDPVFDDALRAVKAYGFDEHGLVRGAKAAREAAWGPADHGYLVQMRHNVEKSGHLISIAAEQVAAAFGAPGQSFDAVVERLDEGYKSWQKAGYPEPDTTPPGDLGYSIRVYPAEGASLEFVPGDKITRLGSSRPANSFWRRRFRDGSILIKFEGEK